MAIPELSGGVLPPGIYDADVSEVIDRFCQAGDTRRAAGFALRDLERALHSAGARYLLVGGSLASDKELIADVDIIAVFERRAAIPSAPPHFTGAGVAVDVQYASEDEAAILDALVEFFQRGRDGRTRGVVRIPLGTAALPGSYGKPAPATLDLVGAVYLNRYFARTGSRRGLLVTIHGIMSHAPWNADLSRLASSRGWVVAPFIYGYQSPLILLQRSKRRAIARKFSDWLHRIMVEEKLPVSVVAHSLGTYIALSYLLGFDEPPYTFEALILTGAILDRNLDWQGKLSTKVRHVLHERAPSDPWVRHMHLLKYIARDDLMGDAGVAGFAKHASFVDERVSELFVHDDMIQPDVIAGRWLPFLGAYAERNHR